MASAAQTALGERAAGTCFWYGVEVWGRQGAWEGKGVHTLSEGTNGDPGTEAE